ncbi:MAG: biotin--[acetyl-CoA-carboxylase] ligase [Bacteroidetes bacterium]|nr:MAG: biotin--[acetyl-CoA-carboxylase] ligase [Bacteroidota bacterium]
MTTHNLFVGQHRIHLAETGSTNNYARQLVRDKMPPEGTLVTTDTQTEGRGQRSNSWVSSPGLNVTGSYILRPVFLAAKDQFMLSASIALAVFDVVSEKADKNSVNIKWPNDVLVNGQKIAGILIENSLRGNGIDHSIVGIGINVNQTEFPSGLNATSLKILTNDQHALDDVISVLNSMIEKRYLQLRQGQHASILSQFNRHLFGFDQEKALTVNGKEAIFRILGVRPSGELQLEDQMGRNSLHQHHEILWHLV